MSEQKNDFQIAWELSQTKDKPFFVDAIKKLLNAYDGEEISFSKFVEELNVAAYKWRDSNNIGLNFKKQTMNPYSTGSVAYAAWERGFIEGWEEHNKPEDKHEVSPVKCNMCNHIWVAVRPEGLEKLECPHCGGMVNFENIDNEK